MTAMSIVLAPAALERVKGFLAADDSALGLRFGVKRTGCSGWGYLVAWGGLSAVDAPEAQAAGAALGAVAGVVVLFEVERFHRRAGWRAESS